MQQAAKKKTVWRLKRTLKRDVSWRPIEPDDVKFVYAAYKQGCDAITEMDAVFENKDLGPMEFYEALIGVLERDFSHTWIFEAPTKRGKIPVGMAHAFFAHPNPRKSPFMTMAGMIWFNWSSPRNRIETALKFFSEISKEVPVVEYAAPDDRKFFEVMAKHGVMRRVGTSHSVYPTQSATIFETRSW